MNVVVCDRPDLWNRYVRAHPQGGPFHLFGWKGIYRRVYGLTSFHLMAVAAGGGAPSPPAVKGILPLALLTSPPNRRRLISLPYLDVAGVLADNSRSERRLLDAAIAVGRACRARWIELRQAAPLRCPPFQGARGGTAARCVPDAVGRGWQISSHKAGLRRALPADSQQLMDSFKSKLRSQIRKAVRNGLTHDVGGRERLPQFYEVFSRNMRDLGSPVHHRRLFEAVFDTFGDRARVVRVRHGETAVAAAIVLRSHGRLHNPWASSLKEYRKLGANMLLYWAMLAHACDMGLATFDFGRSSPGAGTFAFKRQWAALPTPLYWYYLTLAGHPVDPLAERISFEAWKRLPVWLSRLVGPFLRRHIGL